MKRKDTRLTTKEQSEAEKISNYVVISKSPNDNIKDHFIMSYYVKKADAKSTYDYIKDKDPDASLWILTMSELRELRGLGFPVTIEKINSIFEVVFEVGGNMKTDMRNMKSENYEFIEKFCLKYKLPVGEGYRAVLSVFLSEYKLSLLENPATKACQTRKENKAKRSAAAVKANMTRKHNAK